jgi:hypothetical protein
MLGEEDGLSEYLTGRILGQRSDGYDRVTRSGGGGDLSSDEFLRKRNPKEDEQWMRQRIVWLLTSLTEQRREGRRCHE